MENEELNLIVERIQDPEDGIQRNALNMLFNMVKTSHGNTISTINFQHLSDKLSTLQEVCTRLEGDKARYLSDIISAICVMGNDNIMLDYRVKGNFIDLNEWGHLYVKKLIGCIIDVKKNILDYPLEATEQVSNDCINFLFLHNAEFEAIDFLLELGWQERVVSFVEKHNYNRIVLYLEDLMSFFPLQDILLAIHQKMGNCSKYLVTLIKLRRFEEAINFVQNIHDIKEKRQCLYILARNRLFYETKNVEEKNILSNLHIKDFYHQVTKELEIEKPSKMDLIMKGLKPENDIKQAALLALSNAFVHMGHSRDPIFFPSENDTKIELYLNEILSRGDNLEIISIAAAYGVVDAWNPDKVMEYAQEYFFSSNDFRSAGNLLGLALSATKTHDDNQAMLNLLLSKLGILLGSCTDPNEATDNVSQIPASTSYSAIAILLGVQSLYSCTNNEELREVLQGLLFCEESDIVFFSAFVLGCVFCGSADEEITSLLLQTFIEKSKESESPFFKFLLLGLGLLFYRRADVESGLLEIDSPLSRHGSVLIKGFQHVESGDPNVIEAILSESFTGETDALLESIGLLSCCLVAIGDDMATQMVGNIASSSLLLDSSHLRGVVPLCYAMLYPSNPNTSIIDTLEKSLNVGEINSVISSLYSLGIIGAGTLNSRISKILDQQYSYYYKDQQAIFALKLSQGLLSLGKGLLQLSPLTFNKSIVVPQTVIGLFTTSFMLLDASSSPLLITHSYLFYLLCQACSTKYVVSSKPLTIRIGQPINVVGVVGDPRRLSSTQTHTTPVVLNGKEQAEVDEDICTSYIEDVIVLKED